jgi:hypothetical protein
MSIYFGFAIADGMFPSHCSVTRRSLSIDQVKALLPNAVSCLNPSHAATIEAAKTRYGLEIQIPATAPRVSLSAGDTVIVMSVRGLPRLDATRHEYTADEIASASFVFGVWSVTVEGDEPF